MRHHAHQHYVRDPNDPDRLHVVTVWYHEWACSCGERWYEKEGVTPEGCQRRHCRFHVDNRNATSKDG